MGVHYRHYDALVVRAVVARNSLKRMLVDNERSINILYGVTFDKKEVDHELILMNSSMYGLTANSIIPMGKITLAKEMRVVL